MTVHLNTLSELIQSAYVLSQVALFEQDGQSFSELLYLDCNWSIHFESALFKSSHRTS